ncbi:MAG: glucan biosynthesis protein G, partial [Shewanella oncorhynchi]
MNLMMNYPTGYPALLKKLPFVILTAIVYVVGINNVNAAAAETTPTPAPEKKSKKFSQDTV